MKKKTMIDSVLMATGVVLGAGNTLGAPPFTVTPLGHQEWRASRSE